jgi:hypothetical protein
VASAPSSRWVGPRVASRKKQKARARWLKRDARA